MTDERYTEKDGTFCDWLRANARSQWTAAVTHRFVRELYTGELDKRVLRGYLVQDYQFVDRFVALLGAAVATAPRFSSRVVLARQLGVVAGDENTYFRRAFDSLGVPQGEREAPWRNATTEAFNELMDSARASGEYAYCLTVLTVAEWLYLDWAQRAPQPLPEEFVCREWIVLHDNQEFREWVGWLRGELDAVGPTLDEPAQSRCREMFVTATQLELDFFDAAYTCPEH
ncbi:MAG: TenA family protein [Sciscionella sp.]